MSLTIQAFILLYEAYNLKWRGSVVASQGVPAASLVLPDYAAPRVLSETVPSGITISESTLQQAESFLSQGRRVDAYMLLANATQNQQFLLTAQISSGSGPWLGGPAINANARLELANSGVYPDFSIETFSNKILEAEIVGIRQHPSTVPGTFEVPSELAILKYARDTGWYFAKDPLVGDPALRALFPGNLLLLYHYAKTGNQAAFEEIVSQDGEAAIRSLVVQVGKAGWSETTDMGPQFGLTRAQAQARAGQGGSVEAATVAGQPVTVYRDATGKAFALFRPQDDLATDTEPGLGLSTVPYSQTNNPFASEGGSPGYLLAVAAGYLANADSQNDRGALLAFASNTRTANDINLQFNRSVVQTIASLHRLLVDPDAVMPAGGDTAEGLTRLAGLLQKSELSGSQVLVSLVGKPPVTLASLASNVGGSGQAYRYALKNLSLLAVVNADYNALGVEEVNSLKLYSSENTAGLTTQWITDRSLMLSKLIELGQKNLGVAGAVDEKSHRSNRTYIDFASGLTVKTRGSAANAGAVESQQVLFGNDQDNGLIGGDAATQGEGDALYGGAGNDYLDGKAGDDYLEGNTGNDTIDGGVGSDLLLGGAGDDTLLGGEGDDTLLGGQGSDTYRITAGQGFDTLTDKDGKVELTIDGVVVTLAGGHAVAGSANTWVGHEGRVFYSLIPSAGTTGAMDLIVTTTAGAFRVRNFESGDLGIALEGTVPDTTVRTTRGPGSYDHIGAENFTLTAPYNSFVLEQRGDHDKIVVDSNNDAWVLPDFGGSATDAGDTLIGGGGNDLLVTGMEDSRSQYELVGNPGIGLISPIYNPAGITDDGRQYRYLFSYADTVQDVGVDHIEGNAGADVLSGGNRHDEMLGGSEGDLLFGGRGADYLDGGTGNDLLFASHSIERQRLTEFAALLPGQTVVASSTVDGTPMWRLLSAEVNGTLSYSLQGLRIVDTTNQIDRPLSLNLGYYVDGSSSIYGNGGDMLFGGTGDDMLIGSHATDYLYGEQDNDTLYGRGGADRLEGGGGSDILYGDGVPGDLTSWAATPTALDGADYLDGGSGNDFLYGGGGDDELIGGEGIDRLYGGDDNDTLTVGAGDYAEGGSGEDTYKINGNAEVVDNAGKNRYAIDAALATVVKLSDISHAAGTLEIVNAGSGGNAPVLTFLPDGTQVLSIGGLRVQGTGWTDGSLASVSVDGRTYTARELLARSPTPRAVEVTAVNQEIVTGLGDDSITVHGSGNTVSAGKGNDQIRLESAGNTVEVESGDGRDTVRLATGVLAAASAVTIALGDQADLASLRIGLVQRNARAVVLYLDSTGTDSITLEPDYGDGDVEQFLANIVVTAGGQTTTLAGLLAAGQEIQGDAGDNYLMAFNKPSVLSGAAGNDVLVGSVFNDTLDGGSGNDTLAGGAGNDEYVWGRGGGNDTVNEESGSNTVRLSNLLAADIVVRNDGGDLFIRVTDTNEWLRISGGFFTEASQSPIAKVVFADGVEWDMAALRLQALQGSAEGDSIWGFGTDDTLEGGDGNDDLRGGGGDDRLIGGAGNDSLGGDSGSDTFVWGRGDGNDQIYDWGGTDDAVEFRGLNASDLTMVRYNGGEVFFWINDTGERLAITQSFYSLEESFYTVEWLRFADGTNWNIQDQSLNIELRERHQFDQILTGWSLGDHIVGGDLDNYLYGVGGDDILDGGAGHDELYGGVGNDTYIWRAGSGDDIVSDYDGQYGQYDPDGTYHGGGGFDSVKLTGLDPSDVLLSYEPGNLDLIIQIISTGETLTVRQGINPEATDYLLERIVFDNGVAWNTDDIWAQIIASHVNHAPEVMYTPADQEIEPQGMVRLDIRSDMFYDEDGDSLTYSVTLANGDPLPEWLVFDVDSMRLEGIAPSGLTGVFSLAIKAVDFFGLETSTNFTFTLVASDVTVQGTAGHDTLSGTPGADVISGGAGNDTLDGGAGDDVYRFRRGDGLDIVNEHDDTEGNVDTIRFGGGIASYEVYVTRDSSLNLYLSIDGTGDRVQLSNWFENDAHRVERVLFADGTVWTADDLIGMAMFYPSEGDDYLRGSAGADFFPGMGGSDFLAGEGGNDTLYGGYGNDYLEGGTGNDRLWDADDSNYYNGGAGVDNLRGSGAADFLMGGTGNDVIMSGDGPDVIAFNVGDGQDTVSLDGTPQSHDDTISLGGAGLDYANLSLRRSGNELVLQVSGSDSLTFTNWYGDPANQTVLNLQLVAEAMTGFDVGSSDPLLNKKIQTFDFQGLVSAFDAALAATPWLSSWALSNGLTQFHLAGSDSAALGGDLAYHYGADGTLAGIGLGKAQDVLTSAQFGAQAQTIHSTASLQEGLIRLG